MVGIPFGPWNGSVVAPPPHPMEARPGSSGLGWKQERIVSTRDMPRVTRRDYALLPGSWTAILEVYRITRRCQVVNDPRKARRDIIALLEPMAWSLEKKMAAEKKRRGGAGNAGSGKKPSSNRTN